MATRQPLGAAFHQDVVMTDWYWANRDYKDHAGDANWLPREALRRAVDIRDRTVEGEALAARPLMLVDTLNLLKDAMGFPPESTGSSWLWSDLE